MEGSSSCQQVFDDVGAETRKPAEPPAEKPPEKPPEKPRHNAFQRLLRDLEREHMRETGVLLSEIDRLRQMCEASGDLSRSEPRGDAPKIGWSGPLTGSNLSSDSESPQNSPRRYPGRRSAVQHGHHAHQVVTVEFGLTPTDDFFISDLVKRQLSEIFRDLYIHDCLRDHVLALITWITELKEPPRVGCLASLIRSSTFNVLCFTVIILNTFSIAITANQEMYFALTNDTQSSSVNWLKIGDRLMLANVFFTGFYVVELLLKITVHRLYFFINVDCWWNITDFILVVLAFLDLWIALMDLGDTHSSANLTFIRFVRILKVVKVFRVIRAVRYIQELRLMFECVVNSGSQLVWSIMMILLVFYMFSLVFVQGLAGYAADAGENLPTAKRKGLEASFGTVWRSMVALFKATTGGEDWSIQYNLVGNGGVGFEIAYLFFIAFFVIVAWNIVTSTFVDKALKLALPDLDALIWEKRKKDAERARELMEMISQFLDEDNNGTVSVAEFAKHITNPRIREFFAVRGLDIKDAQVFLNMLQSASDDMEAVDVKTFVGCALRLQGMATSIDLQTMYFDMKRMYHSQNAVLARIQHLVSHIATENAKDTQAFRIDVKSLRYAQESHRAHCQRIEDLVSRLSTAHESLLESIAQNGMVKL